MKFIFHIFHKISRCRTVVIIGDIQIIQSDCERIHACREQIESLAVNLGICFVVVEIQQFNGNICLGIQSVFHNQSKIPDINLGRDNFIFPVSHGYRIAAEEVLLRYFCHGITHGHF